MTDLPPIPLKTASIEWNDDAPSGAVTAIYVYDQADRTAVAKSQRLNLASSTGCCCADWANGSDPALTPEGVFATLVNRGFETTTLLIETLEGFARIEGCDWARKMLGAAKSYWFVDGERA